MPALVTDRATHLRALAVLAGGGRFGRDHHARDLDAQADACERGEALRASYHWLHSTTLVAAMRYAMTAPALSVDYLRTLWIALAHDERASLRAELEPLARAFRDSRTGAQRARAVRDLDAWVKARDFAICRAFAAPFRDLD